MSELMRFRLTRAPQGYVPNEDNFIRLDIVPPEESSEFDAEAFERALETLLNSTGESAEGDGYENGKITVLGKPLHLEIPIAELDRWLSSKGNRPAIPDLTNKLIKLSGVSHKEYEAILHSFNETSKENLESSSAAEVVNTAVEKLSPKDGDIEPTDNLIALHIAAQTFINKSGISWWVVRRSVAFSLIVAMLRYKEPSLAMYFNRLMLVFGLVELLAKNPIPLRNTQDILGALRNRTVILPQSLYDWLRGRDPRSFLARRPGFADLYVVREEWNRYVAGEIAHIENVMASETRERLHERTTENEETITLDTELNTLDERSTETTDRFELQQETSRDSSMNITLDGQVDTSGQYGPTKVDTHLGGSFDYSLDESQSQASSTAREVVARATIRVERKVREARTTRNLTRIFEKNRHVFENTGDGAQHIVGIYRWVDKIKTVQIFRYPNRFLMEFQVPEPGAWLRWLLDSPNRKPTIAENPPPLKIEKPSQGLPPPPPPGLPPPPVEYVELSAELITSSNYLDIGARYKTLGLEPPPENKFISTTISWQASQPEDTDKIPDYKGDEGGGEENRFIHLQTNAGDASFAVPDTHRAVRWWATVTAFTATRIENKVLKLPLEVWVGVGNAEPIRFRAANQLIASIPLPPNPPIALPSPDLFEPYIDDLKGPNSIYPANSPQHSLEGITGRLPISVMARFCRAFSVHVTVECLPTDKEIRTWQIDTYEKIAQAYYAMKRQYDEELAAREVRSGVVINGQSPLRNAEMAREEIKKAVIEMLTGSDFTGRNAIQRSAGEDMKPLAPEIQLDKAREFAPEIQFLEQVFEWENMTYVLYPYFWAGKDQWDKLADLNGEDPDFARFLRAGSARVVLPARPKFETEAMLYVYLGIMWGSGSAPAPDDQDYLSIADEIRAQQKPPPDGEPGESWEVRLPTTLVWLDNLNSSMPVKKLVDEQELDSPPKKNKKPST